MLFNKFTTILIVIKILSISAQKNEIFDSVVKAIDKHIVKAIASSKDAMNYLAKFGYMDKKEATDGMDMKSGKMKAIIMDYQRFMGLRETGELDNKTMSMMNAPRCGVADNIDPRRKTISKRSDWRRRVRRYQLQGSVWETRNLTWKVVQYSTRANLRGKERDIDAIMGYALSEWSKHTRLDFAHERGSRKANIEIKFTIGNHNDGNPFDGPGKTLAHAFFPGFGGATHFDDQESWTIDGSSGVDLLSVAVHEFGHALGLGHSDDRGSLMYPTYAGKRYTLMSDDINGIEMLYGKRQNVVQTPVLDRKEVIENPKVIARAPDLCADFRLDAADCVDDGLCFFFRDNYVWRIEDDTSVHAGYPKLISDVFPGLTGKLDAVFTDASNKQTYVIKGDRVWIYRQPMQEPIVANKPINEVIKKLGATSIDAATRWGFNGKSYLFKNDQYWRFDGDRQQQIGGRYPQSLRVWHRVPINVDAAMYWPRSGKTYFFKGAYYYRFNDLTSSIDEANPPFPREASKWWLKCQTNRLVNENDIDDDSDDSVCSPSKGCTRLDESLDPSSRDDHLFASALKQHSSKDGNKFGRFVTAMKGLFYITG